MTIRISRKVVILYLLVASLIGTARVGFLFYADYCSITHQMNGTLYRLGWVIEPETSILVRHMFLQGQAEVWITLLAVALVVGSFILATPALLFAPLTKTGRMVQFNPRSVFKLRSLGILALCSIVLITALFLTQRYALRNRHILDRGTFADLTVVHLQLGPVKGKQTALGFMKDGTVYKNASSRYVWVYSSCAWSRAVLEGWNRDRYPEVLATLKEPKNSSSGSPSSTDVWYVKSMDGRCWSIPGETIRSSAEYKPLLRLVTAAETASYGVSYSCSDVPESHEDACR